VADDDDEEEGVGKKRTKRDKKRKKKGTDEEKMEGKTYGVITYFLLCGSPYRTEIHTAGNT